MTILAGVLILGYGVRLLLKPGGSEQMADITERMDRVSSAPAPTIIAAGAALANPGVFMLVAAKSIWQLDPSTAQYVIDWALFAGVALIPLGVALRCWWIERHARTLIAVILLALSLSLLRDGITRLTG